MYDYDDSWYYQDDNSFEGEYNPYYNEIIDEVSNRCDFGEQSYIFDVNY